MSVELISVHIPKTAGGTFWQLLHRSYGAEHVQYQDADRITDPASIYNLDPQMWRRDVDTTIAGLSDQVKVIHGHFPAIKFWGRFPGAKLITWLRHPVSRVISHYYFWKNLSPEDSGHTLHKYMLEQDLDLVEFAALHFIRNFITDHYLRDFQLTSFDFIGIQEHFSTDLVHLGDILGKELCLNSGRNRNVNIEPGYRNKQEEILADTETIRCLEDLNRKDLELYRFACELRLQRR